MHKVTLADMQRLAKSRAGKCLSTTYINSYSKLTWECEEGHQWEASLKSIRLPRWCPVCAGNQKKTLADMRHLAKQHGGKCLSTTYINSASKLLWQCKQGHRWEAQPTNIQQGHWCPICPHEKRRSEKLQSLERQFQEL